MDSDTNGSLAAHKDERGRFLPGNPGKQAGTTYKAPNRLKTMIVDFLELNTESIQESYDQLKPLEKLQFITALMPYAVPKLQNIHSEIDQKTEHSGKLTIEIVKSNGNLESNTGI